GDRDAGRGLVLKTLQNGVDVIGPLLLIGGEEVDHELREAALVGTRLGDQRQVGRRRAAIGRARGLLVRERRREVVRRAARTLEHLAVVVRAVLDLVLRRERRCLRRRVAGAAGVGEVAERDIGQAVAGRADFLVDLQATLQRAAIILAEPAGKGPLLGRR